MQTKQILATIFLTACSFSPYMDRDDVIQETKNRLPSIEQKLEITYGFKKRSPPKINYEKEPELQIVKSNSISFANYDQIKNEITIYYDNIWKQTLKQNADAMWDEGYAERYEERNIETILTDVLTRFHLDKISEESGNGSFPGIYANMTKHDKWADAILMLGIVSYVKNDGNNEVINYEDYRYLVNMLDSYIEGTLNLTGDQAISAATLMGEHIVYPIIKKNKKEGVQKIIEIQTTFNTGIKYPVSFRKEVTDKIARNN